MAKFLLWIKSWFEKPLMPGPGAGPIFRPIFKKEIINGKENTDEIDSR
jgi:hypothetical protein